jgi:hypothetical protein
MSEQEIFEAAKQTITLMTASRLAAGMAPDAAVKSAVAAFMRMCEEG